MSRGALLISDRTAKYSRDEYEERFDRFRSKHELET